MQNSSIFSAKGNVVHVLAGSSAPSHASRWTIMAVWDSASCRALATSRSRHRQHSPWCTLISNRCFVCTILYLL